jgi:CheY-like chemotaxis protein
VVRADEKRVLQILINLLGNAIKFTAAGQVTLRLAYAREFASVEIEDTGPGMPAEDIARIFEPFARGNSAGASAAPGAGLGLTIAKMLTDLMGGEMSVQSEVAGPPGSPVSGSVGTLFRIRLFLPEVSGVHVASELPRNARSGYAGARRRVLVVDNEEIDRDLLANLLEPLGFEIGRAASGQACLDLLQHTSRDDAPDAILMDLAMPGIDGWATVRAIRERGLSDAPIAIVSGNAFDKGLDNDVGIAADDFILKPVRGNELLDWLGTRLQLEWHEAPARETPVAAAPAPIDGALPDAAQLRALDELVSLGYYRGIVRKLDEIEALDAGHAGFAAQLRSLAQQFQLDAMTRIIRQTLNGQAAT